MFKPKYKPNQLICGTGNIAIITGWTIRQSIASKLDKSDYAVIGNLYSPTRGISPLIRNLLCNPQVTNLIILIATKEDGNSGSCQALADFFAHGFAQGLSDTGRKCWLIKSPIKSYIDIEIEQDILNLLRKSINFKVVNNVKNCIESLKVFKNLPVFSWGEPMVFPETETIPTILPGETYGHRVQGKTIAETWIKILHRIKNTGVIRPTGYDGKWQELIDLMAVVTDEPKDFYFPEPNYLPLDREFLQEYIPQILEDAPKQENVKYTYGQRLRSWFGVDQIEQVVEKLSKEIDAASAVMTLWDVQDHIKGGSPCLNHIWLRVVDNKLSLTAVFRSNDMFSAWPANAMGLWSLQQHIQTQINNRSAYDLELGPLITISQSAHIYDDTWENVDKVIAEHYQKTAKKINYDDPIGNFLIEIEGQEIVIKQTTPGSGELVTCYQGTNPLKLIREIAATNPAIEPGHIGYLGIELQKARQSLGSGPYTQDR